MQTEDGLYKDKKTGNPIVYLFRKSWHYAAGNRHKVVLYWCMFIVGNGVVLVFHPLVIAKIMNVIQEQGITELNIRYGKRPIFKTHSLIF